MRLDAAPSIPGLTVLEARALIREFTHPVLDLNIPWLAGKTNLSEVALRSALQAFMDCGYLKLVHDDDRYTWVRTLDGSSFALARATKPYSRIVASNHLRALMVRIQEVNADQALQFHVCQAAVFGSYLTDVETVGDIDVLISLIAKPVPETNDGELPTVVRARLRASAHPGRRFNTHLEWLQWPEKEVWLRLKARSPVLSLHDSAEQRLPGASILQLFPVIDSVLEEKLRI